MCSEQSDYIELKKLAYDGRYGDSGWMTQDIDSVGYHYYMTPETATEGLNKLNSTTSNKQWNYSDYPDLSAFSVFNNGSTNIINTSND